jgi:osmoprotectant transport system ATP-binding protein
MSERSMTGREPVNGKGMRDKFVVRGVNFWYGSKQALFGNSLAIPDRSVMALIGPSGCGKSTLLRALVGLVVPDSGTVRIDGVEMTPDSARSLRTKLGYVIQDGGLFPHLTARDNVSIMARQLGWDKPRMTARVEELAGLVRLPLELLDRYPTQMSGGQRQRVGIMRALMLDPAVLLLDEPMGALDPMVRADLQQDLKEIFRQMNKIVVMVTHDMGEAGFFGDVVLLLGDGRVIQKGTLDDFIRAPADDFVRRFINAQRLPTVPAPEGHR